MDNHIEPSSSIASQKLAQRIQRWRWQAPVFALLLVLVQQLLEHTILLHLPRWQHFASQMLFYGVIGPVLAWWALTFLAIHVGKTVSTQQELEAAHRQLNEANQRLMFLMQVSHRLAVAEDEEALVEEILAFPMAVVPAIGSSLIRFDERGQPLPVVYRGNLDQMEIETWANHLASAELRQACEACVSHHAGEGESCPVLNSLPKPIAASQVHCLPLMRSQRKIGVLNIYLSDSYQLDERAQTFLSAMAEEVSLALESHRLRSRELTTLYRLQQTRRVSNLHGELADVLNHTVDALEIAGGLLFLSESEGGEMRVVAQAGSLSDSDFPLIENLAASAMKSDSPLVIDDFGRSDGQAARPRSLLVAALRTEDSAAGSMVLWTTAPNAFNRRHARLVATVANQAGLLIENHRLYLQSEHQAALAERARLAREIHDGIAQTLGYLKLRMAQINAWLESGESERAYSALHQVRELIAGAYTDMREAIDGLRLRPNSGAIDGWLEPVLAEFRKLSDIEIESNPPPDMIMPLEIQVQLSRIVQEALGNIRKHSGASHAWLEWSLEDQWLHLVISDDGHGFEPDEVPPLSRHGLKIMQERAELLDADFQITSRYGAGTQIEIRLPVPQTHGVQSGS